MSVINLEEVTTASCSCSNGSSGSDLTKQLLATIESDDQEALEHFLETNSGCLDENCELDLSKVVKYVVLNDKRTCLGPLLTFYSKPEQIVHDLCIECIDSDKLMLFQYILRHHPEHVNLQANVDTENGLLYMSSSKNRAQFVKHLVEVGADVNSPNLCGMTALGAAVTNGHVETTEVLIEAGALPTTSTSIHLLMLASHLGHAGIIEVLLKCGLGQTESNQFKQNALMVASKKGHTAIVELLLKAGYDLECSDRFGYTPLMYSVVEGHIDVVRILLERGCNPLSKRWSAKDTALHFAASYGHLEITALLLEYISDPDVPDCIGITPLYLAAEEGHLKVVEILAPRCDLYSMCGDKGRPLDAAVEYGHLDCLKYFLTHGDTVTLTDNNGRTPLMKAACRGHENMVGFLLDEFSDINAKDDHGKTALSYAVLSMNPKCVEILITKGASVNVTDSDGLALLMIAIKVGQPATVSLFILGGADLDSKWRVNRALDPLYPLELAVKQENFDVVQLLVRAGCTISMQGILSHWNRIQEESTLRYRLHTLAGQPGSTMSLTNDNEAIRSFLKKHAAEPYSLKCHCRKVIWQNLDKPFWCSVSDLPLPALIKEYLLMTDNTCW